MTDLEWLCDWFDKQCDGDWEHEFGIAIGTLDNPGWSLRIDLTNTSMADAPLAPLAVEDGDRWMRLWKDASPAIFHGACSPTMLPETLARYREWVTAAST